MPLKVAARAPISSFGLATGSLCDRSPPVIVGAAHMITATGKAVREPPYGDVGSAGGVAEDL